MSDTQKTVRGTVTRDFKDAGTERQFTEGSTETFTAGEFLNFEAAGLVRKPTPEKAKPKAAIARKRKPATTKAPSTAAPVAPIVDPAT
jgi:hypothetical protein